MDLKSQTEKGMRMTIFLRYKKSIKSNLNDPSNFVVRQNESENIYFN